VDILDDMLVSKLSAKVFFKVNYSFKMLNKILNLTFENHANEFSYNEMNIEENYIYFSFSKQRIIFIFHSLFGLPHGKAENQEIKYEKLLKRNL